MIFQRLTTIAARLATPRANISQPCSRYDPTPERRGFQLQKHTTKTGQPKPSRLKLNLLPGSYNSDAFAGLLLLCAVDELVFVGSLEARLHSFVVPQLLCVIKELLQKKEKERGKFLREILQFIMPV